MSKRVKRKSSRPEAGTAQVARRDNVIHLPRASRAEPNVLDESDANNASDVESTTHRQSDSMMAPRGTHTLSSHEHDDDHAEVERFFSSEPPAHEHSRDHFHDFETDEHHDHDPVHAAGHHRGRMVTLAVGLLGTALIGGFLIYNKLLMPTPEDLGAAPRVALPTPAMLEPAAELVAAAPATASPSAGVAEEPAPVLPEPAPERVIAAAQPAPAAAPTPVAAQATPVAAPAPAAAPTAAAVQPTSVNAATATPVAAPAGAVAAPAGYSELVAQARKQGFKKSAEASFVQAITVHPAGSDALSGLAMLYLNQNKHKLARDRARESVDADATNSEGWIVLGAALSALGDAPGARDAYARCATQGVGKYVTECKRMRR